MKHAAICLSVGMLALSGMSSAQFGQPSGSASSRQIVQPSFCCGVHHERHLRPPNAFTPFFAAPFYFDEANYSPSVPPQPTIVVIRDEKEAQKSPDAIAAQQPKLVEFPAPQKAKGTAVSFHPLPAIFVRSDGRKFEAADYTITYSAIFIHNARRETEEIRLDQLDIEATLAANQARGLELKIPRSASELFLSF